MSYTYLDQQDLKEENLINDESFIEDAALFLEDREGYEFDYSNETQAKQDIYDAYMEHFRVQNVNEVTATRDLFYAQTADDESKARMNRLMNTFDTMDGELGWKAAGDYIEGVFTAPSTYAGMFSFGAAKAGALAAQQGIKLGIREILKKGATESLKKQGLRASAGNIAKETAKAGVGKRLVAKTSSAYQGFKAGGWKTMAGAMAVDGAFAAYTVTQQERTRKELGITDELSLSNIGLATSFSLIGSGTIGAITGTKRALSSNVAEQIRQVAIGKESKVIESVHKNITTKTKTNRKTAGDFKKIKRKLSLLDTVPEKIAEGKKMKTPEGGLAGDLEFISGKFVPTLEEKFHDNIASAASKILAKVDPIVKTVKTKKGKDALAEERITSRLARGLTNGKITDVGILKILDEHGLSMNQLSSLLVEEYSQAGRLLGKAGKLAKKEKEQLLKELTEVDQKLINLSDIMTPAKKALEESEKAVGSRVRNVMSKWLGLPALNKARIGFMTIQTATTARNTTNGYMRNYVYALDNLGAGLYNVTKASGQGLIGLANKDMAKEASRSVAKGLAQMRTGGQSAYMKDLWLGTKSWETEALELLFRDKRFADSDTAKMLFREMGDVGEEVSTEGGIVKVARMANVLNTMSDNLFKRAIFSREIDKYMKATDIARLQQGGLKRSDALAFSTDEKVVAKIMGDGLNPLQANYYAKGLRNFFEDSYLDPATASKTIGKFSQIEPKAIGDAMEKALEFSYQTGKFSSKEGGFNNLADWFIKTASKNILFSSVVPFPRYLINQLIFQYEHAPILGLINFGGILNKKGGKKGVRGVDVGLESFGVRLALDDEAIGKQLGGLATIAAFYGIRNKFGDENTGPYEFKISGSTYNLEAALGPFMGAAWIADWLYRHTGPKKQGSVLGMDLPQLHDNDKVAVGISGKPRDAINAFLGGSAKGGSGLWIVDSSVDSIINSKDVGGPSDMTLDEVMFKFAGNFFNSALVPAGMLKDIAGTILDPAYRVVQDNSSVDMVEYMLKQATRSLPNKYEPEEGDIPVYRPSRNKPLYNVNPFMKMLTGFNEQETRTAVENEMARLRFDYREYAPRKIKGDAPFANLAKGEMGYSMDKYVLPYILSEDYNKLETDKLKRYELRSLINEYRTLSRVKVLQPLMNDTPVDRNRKLKAIFISLPAEKRDIVTERYKHNTGESLYMHKNHDKTKGDYLKGIEYYIEMFGKDDQEFLALGKDVKGSIQ